MLFLRQLASRSLAGLRPRHALLSYARHAHAAIACAAAARSGVGTRALAVLLAVGWCAAPQKLPLCLELPPPPELAERKLGKKDRLNIVLVGKTGHGKSSITNILAGAKDKFKVSDDFRSVTSEIQFADFEYKGRQVRVIDTPGFFDTSMPPEEIQAALNQFGDVACEGITALLIVVKKERFTAENAAVCEFVHCVLGDGALQKYGVMVMTHSNDPTDALRSSLEALPSDNWGVRVLGLVKGRLLSVETRNWRHTKIRENVLQQVFEMHTRNEGAAADPLMLQWARIRQLEAAKFEASIQPRLEELEEEHKRRGEAMQSEIEAREAQWGVQLQQLEQQLERLQDADGRRQMRREIEGREAAHLKQIEALKRQVEQAERQAERQRRQTQREIELALRHGGGVEVDEEAVLQQAAAAGDLGWIKRAAHQQKVDEIDSKARSEWAERTRRFGRSVTGVSTCGIQ